MITIIFTAGYFMAFVASAFYLLLTVRHRKWERAGIAVFLTWFLWIGFAAQWAGFKNNLPAVELALRLLNHD